MNDNDNQFKTSYTKDLLAELNEPTSPSREHHTRTRGLGDAQSSIPSNASQTPSESDAEQKSDELSRTLQRLKENAEEVEKQNTLVSADFRWLKGKANERAIFWVWLYLKKITKRNSPVMIVFRNDEQASYHAYLGEDDEILKDFWLNGPTGNTEERSTIIIAFFEKLANVSNNSIARSLLNRIRSIWSDSIYPVRDIGWINKLSELELDWIWGHLIKKEGFKNGALSWFKPVDNKERRLAIIGAIDNYHLYGDENDIDEKNRILDRLKSNYNQNERRGKRLTKNKKAMLNAEISASVKDMLAEMAKEKEMRINKFIEKLILEEYSRFKRNE